MRAHTHMYPCTSSTDIFVLSSTECVAHPPFSQAYNIPVYFWACAGMSVQAVHTGPRSVGTGGSARSTLGEPEWQPMRRYASLLLCIQARVLLARTDHVPYVGDQLCQLYTYTMRIT